MFSDPVAVPFDPDSWGCDGAALRRQGVQRLIGHRTKPEQILRILRRSFCLLPFRTRRNLLRKNPQR